MTGRISDVDAIVVGAGPSGLVAAIRLLELGLSVRIVDAADSPAQESRAALMHAATVELLAGLGIERQLLEESVRIAAVTLADGDRMLARMPFDRLDTAYPFALSIPQSTTESLLIDRLQELGGHVERGIRIQTVGQHGDVCRVSGESLRDGQPWEAVSTYVIGADGKHSIVREQAGIYSSGAAYDEDFILADVELAPPPVAADEARIALSPHGVTVIGLLPSGRYRIVATADAGAETPSAPGRTYLDDLMRTRGLPTRTADDPVWSSRFRIGHHVAHRLRVGHILLCGDAAHTHSPAAGQGMNTGIADAYDLAESIAVAATDATALDGYERRRLRAARQVVNLTDRITRLALLRARPARALRNTLIRAIVRLPRLRHALVRSISGLDRSPRPGRP